uniref:FUSC family protein n=1 Tax=Cyclophora tenuis TaxID=216820 RepID=A0A7S1CZ26_CYCTE|mmetsp:Transcript_13252/g.22546  ORF Transcript_13252/g.22546 Transcript_13252/m.22546 type:complete len:420 (+) Transcript_13252:30-1289(+)
MTLPESTTAAQAQPDTNNNDDEYKPNQFSGAIQNKQRIYQSCKVGLGVVLASLTVLIQPWDRFFHGTGQWAVITVVVVILETPGDTTRKIVNRFVGTLVAAVLALLIGTAGHEISTIVFPIGELLVATTILITGVVGRWYSSSPTDWAYGILLGTATYPFMALDALRDDEYTAIFRTIMIALGGLVGFVLAWLPPSVKASDVAQAYLVDQLIDTACCVEAVVEDFLEGKELNRVTDIYAGGDDDRAHRLYKAVTCSRPSLESAVHASKWESSRHEETQSYQVCGLSVRLVLRAIQAADIFLRNGRHPLRSGQIDVQLELAMRELSNVIQKELLTTVEEIGYELPSHLTVDNFPEIDLPTALLRFRHALAASLSSWSDETDVFTSLVAFSRLLEEAGTLALQVKCTVVQNEESTVNSEDA